jgi:hypothetical protein
MATYVDRAEWEWRGRKWCHLLADDIDELHSFAASLGLKPSWFQDKGNFPHYDLTESKRELALRRGAVAVSRQEVWQIALALRVKFLRVRRAHAAADLC